MNRKEMGCAVVGAVLGAAGCSPAVTSLALPVANAEDAASVARADAKEPHVVEIHLSLISGTTKDISSVEFRLEPRTGWSINSSDSRLQATLERGHVAILQAPEYEAVQFLATVSITHVDGMHFLVRCHVEAGCTAP